MSVTRWRFRVVRDTDYRPEGCDGKPLPESAEVYADNPLTPGGGPPLSYAEYCRTYGDPDQHVGVGVITERMRPNDEDWRIVESLWGIDFMASDAEVDAIGQTFYRPEDLPGYLADMARESQHAYDGGDHE